MLPAVFAAALLDASLCWLHIARSARLPDDFSRVPKAQKDLRGSVLVRPEREKVEPSHCLPSLIAKRRVTSSHCVMTVDGKPGGADSALQGGSLARLRAPAACARACKGVRHTPTALPPPQAQSRAAKKRRQAGEKTGRSRKRCAKPLSLEYMADRMDVDAPLR